MLIHRAICFSTHETMVQKPETIAFIQASTRAEAADKFRRVLGEVWDVPAGTVDFYNLNDETELFSNAFGGAETGDARFFEVGFWDDRQQYTNDLPLLLVKPDAHARLATAWEKLPKRPENGRPNLSVV